MIDIGQSFDTEFISIFTIVEKGKPFWVLKVLNFKDFSYTQESFFSVKTNSNTCVIYLHTLYNMF